MEVETKFNQKTGMEKYVAEGNHVVDFKLIRRVEDFDDKTLSFRPEMCHQIFGEGEVIFGYENLDIKLYFTAGSLKPYVGIKYSDKMSPRKSDGVEADNIPEKLAEVIPDPYFTNLDLFSACIEKEAVSFRPYGELIHSFRKTFNPKKSKQLSMQNGHGAMERTFEVYSCDTTVPNFENYLKHIESFVKWFIDAASFIDPEDEKWKLFVLYEKYKSSDGSARYAFIGYSSVYNFFSYPENIRPRVAQMLILPPFQKQGLAIELLSAIYSRYRSDKKTVEITVEDPSDDFEVLRDYVDSTDCMKLPSFAPEKLRNGYSKEMGEEAHRVLRMTKRQARRIYEILRLRNTNIQNEEEFKKFRLEVKQRLNIPYQKQDADIKRMEKRKMDSSVLQSVSRVDDATRKTALESNFQNLYSHYNNILARLDKYVVS